MTFIRILQQPPKCFYLTRRLVSTNASLIKQTASPSLSPSPSPSSSQSSPNPPTPTRTPTPTPTQIPTSSCQENTTLEGLNYLKSQAPILALKDNEYPEWLWNITKVKVYEDDGVGGKKERVERRKKNKQGIKDRNFMSTQ